MKNKKRLLLSLCCALMISTVPMGLAACNKNKDKDKESSSESTSTSDVLETFDGGEYYAGGTDEAASGANTLSVGSDGSVTLKIGEQTLTGTYTYKNNSFTMTFTDKSTATAIVSGGTITLAYNGATYNFLEKVEYTVSFSVEGTVSSTKKVVNGRPMSKPADPVKEGYTFVGWYTDSEFTKSFTFDSMAVTSDLTLYARFVEAGAQEYTVTLIVDGETWKTVDTVGGVAANLGVPEKAGFIGWWIGDSEGNTTAEYKGEVLKENTILVAVFESEAPIVSVTATEISWTAKGVNNSYVVTIKGPDGQEIDSTSTGNASYAFDFASQAPGVYTIEVSLNGKVGTATYRNKFLAAVSNFQVVGNSLVFNAVENATKYLITSECGTATHVHEAYDNGSSTVYDFSQCDMKADGIKFTVTAVAEGWMSSSSKPYAVVRNLAATAVSVDKATETASWTAVENATSYDVSINGTVVATNVTGTSFDLKGYAPATLNIKVTAKAHGYNASTAEFAYTKTSLLAPANISLEGSTLTWDSVASATGYIIKVGDKELPAVSDNQYTLTNADLPAGVTSCAIQIKAIGATADANSLFSDAITVQFGAMSDNVQYANGAITWDPVLGAKGYEVQSGGTITPVAANVNSCAISFTKAGLHMIQVRCTKADDTKSDWVAAYVDVYETTFDVSGGGAVAPIYAAEGDTVQLATASKAGYNFIGWFNTPNGTNGTEYTTFVQGGEDMTVYAHWDAKKYIVKLNAGVGTVENTEKEVTFDQGYEIPRPTTTSEDLFFGGWYTEPNGAGIKYTNDAGASVNVWRNTDEITLHAYWIDNVLTYVEMEDEENGGKGYEVYAGINASKLSIIRIPETYKGKTVIGIGSEAFYNQKGLVKLEIPDTIQEITSGKDYSTYSEGSAFRGCTNLREFEVYETAGGHDRHYKSLDGLLVRNASEGKTLVFYSESLGGTLEIPEGIEVIPGKVFEGTDLTGVVLPSSLKRIEANAFEDAWKLKTVEFANVNEDLAEDNSNGLTISEYAFYLCTQIESITLPARTLKLADETATDASIPVSFGLIFRSCPSLQAVNVAKPQTEGACYYTSQDGMVCDKTGMELIYCVANRTGKVTIPASISSIGKEAFVGCEQITSVEIHAFVTSIGESAFNGCKGLGSVVFLGEATDAPINIATKAFYGCSNLKNLELPANLGTLEAYAFGVTSSLTDVRVEVGKNAVIKDAAFGSESKTPTFNVTSLYIGDNVPVINVAGVFGSEKLLEIDVSQNNPNYMNDENGVLYNKVWNKSEQEYQPTKILFYPVALTAENYVIPATIEEIGAEVFSGRKFKSITIGEKVRSIGENAFADCLNLETVTFANVDAALVKDAEATDETPAVVGNSLTIATNAFNRCKALKMVTLPVRLVSIGDTAFGTCESMTGKLTIPANVTSVGKKAFNGCAGITEVEVKGVETLFTYESSKFTTFTGCKALTKIVVDAANENYTTANGVLYIKKSDVASELAYCPASCVGEVVTAEGVSTNTVKVPNTVTTVWASAFAEALEVESVIFLENTETPVNLALKANSFAGASGAKLKSVVLPEGMKEIAASSFASSLITSITIPKSVTTIGDKAFNGSKSLTEVIFVEGGTEGLKIGTTITGTSTTNGVFKDCTALVSVNLPNRVTQLGNAAFYNTAITAITIPDGITSLGQGVFTNCSKLATVTFGANSELTTIGNTVFMGCESLAEIDIPDTVTSMGLNAFNGTQLVNVQLPAELTSLNYSFKEIKTLKSITFAEDNKVTSIVKDALSGCSSLTTISIPSNVKTIGDNAFKGCSSLSSVTFETNDEGKTALTSIGASAFAGTALTEFILPETSATSLTVGGTMFTGCDKITKVSLPKQVSMIGTFFKGCFSITEVSLPDNVNLWFEDGIVYNNQDKTIIHYVMKDIATADLVLPDSLTAISDYAFANQPALKTVSIPASINSIGTYAFNNCYNLQKVTFRAVDGQAESLTSIPASLFRACTSLTTIEGLPSTVTSIGNYAFYGCEVLSKLNSTEGKTEINLPTGLKTLGTDVFNRCSAITKIAIPDGVTTIGSQVFQYCTSLSEVTFGEDSKLTSLGNRAFEYCESLKNFDMPDTVTSLAYSVFASSGIETIHMSTKLTSMSGQVFQYATKLKAITIPEGVVKLDYYTFEGCTSLGAWDEETQAYGKVVLPSTLTTISYQVFADCTSLTEITIPDSVTMLGQANSWSTSRYSYVFRGCTALKTVNLGGVTQIGNEAFKDCTALETIDLSKVTDMNSNVFENCTSLKSVDLSSLKKMQASVFQGCTNLETVTFGNAVDTIGNYAFAGTKLTNVTLPATVTKISDGLFQGCINLETFKYEGKITSIGSYAFEDCVKMTEFIIPSSLTSALGGSVFAGTSITSITLPRAYTKTWGSNNAPFAGCEGLTEILVESGNPMFTSIDGIVYDLDGKLWAVPNGKTFADDTFKIPEGTEIDNAAKPFAGCKIGTVILPESMTAVAQRMFDDALVETVVLGSQTESIGSWAFRNATNLKRILKKDADGVAQTSLEGLTTISSQAFLGASALESIVLPDSLTSMSSNAFENAGLTSLTIGSGLAAIPANAFQGTKITSIVIPATVTSIGKYAFAGSALTSVVIPANVTLGDYIFQGCTDLSNVSFEAGVTSLPTYAFEGCTALTSITLPESLTSIGSYAFANTSLTNIEVPAAVESIGAYAFAGTSLASVTLKEGLATIGNSAFAGTPLTSIVLPSTVTSIGTLAFENCALLTGINVPASLTSIGDSAFAGCTSISSIVLSANVSVGDYAFSGWTADQTVYVTMSEYTAVNTWPIDTTYGTLWNKDTNATFVFDYVAQA